VLVCVNLRRIEAELVDAASIVGPALDGPTFFGPRRGEAMSIAHVIDDADRQTLDLEEEFRQTDPH
jgi:hypothetical protein